MESEYITFIWLAKFDSQTQLAEYVEWKYLENENDPKCNFAADIAIKYVDSDFLEAAFAAKASELLEQLNNISFVENFKPQLLAKIGNTACSDKNSIISLSGKKDIHGGINEKLFDFTPTQNDKEHLHFVGFFKYKGE